MRCGFCRPRGLRTREFRGCAECGSDWLELAELFADITTSVERYPHRARCYARKGAAWLPARRQPMLTDEIESEQPPRKKRPAEASRTRRMPRKKRKAASRKQAAAAKAREAPRTRS